MVALRTSNVEKSNHATRMIVACKMCVYLLGGSGAMPPRKIKNFHPLRLLLTQSGTKFPNNILVAHTCVK